MQVSFFLSDCRRRTCADLRTSRRRTRSPLVLPRCGGMRRHEEDTSESVGVCYFYLFKRGLQLFKLCMVR